ncbi:GLPGLI family protein [Salegentibacter sp. HM20]
MRVLFLLFFIIIFFDFSAQSQKSSNLDYKITYDLTYKLDSTNLDDVKNEKFFLYRGGNSSMFASEGRILQDSLKRKGTGSLDISERMERIRTNFKYVIYKGIPENKISYTYRIIRDNFRYEENLNQFAWEILPETKLIKGFTAQKATTSYAGRDYEAWFTSEIPIPDGPYKFNGLPGLILEVADSQDHYVFTFLELEKLKNTSQLEFNTSELIKTDKDKLGSLIQDYKLNPFATLERSNTPDKTITINFKEGQKEKLLKEAREQVARENNPIELN